MLLDLNIHIIGRLLLAALLGGVVGLERELRHKPAGLRTMLLISVGSALYSIISYEAASAFGGDHTRIAAQIIPGIGFIGAGVVIRDRGAVTGITSAATIFVIASVGMAVGSGLPVTAIFTTFLLLVALVALGIFEDRAGIRSHRMTFRMSAKIGEGLIENVHKIVEAIGINAQRWKTQQTDGRTQVEFDAELNMSQERELFSRLNALNIHGEGRPTPA
ncbi:MAG: MgtC/SapB family protein [Candidatus Acidiferrales bacterium]